MAGQNITAIGLDVSDFNDQKKQTLQEFIALFDKLSQYDGSKITPLSIDGLNAFNSSIAKTNDLIDQLNAGLASLQQKQQSFSTSAVAANEQMLKSILDAIQAQTAQTAAIEATRAANQAAARSAQQASAASRQASRDALQAAKQAEQAARDESRAQERLLSDYQLLKQAIKDQQVLYSNLYINKGKNAPETKAALTDLRASQSIVNGIDQAVSSGARSGQLFGGSLGKALGSVRTLAYILPGIGMAGIFNLAFEAIEKVVGAISGLNDKLVDEEKNQTDINNTLKEQISIYNELIKSRKEYLDEIGDTGSKAGERQTDINKSFGANLNQTLAEGVANARTKFQGISNTVGGTQGLALTESAVISSKDTMYKLLQEVDSWNKLLHDKKSEFYQSSDIKVRIDQLKSDIEYQKELYSAAVSNTKDYYEAKQDLDKKDAELQKFNADQARKLYVDTEKQKLETTIAANELIIKSAHSTQKEILEAEQAKYSAQQKVISLDTFNITANNSTSNDDIILAKRKQLEELLRLDQQYNEETNKVNEGFEERNLKAKTISYRNELEISSEYNHSITQNTEKSLQERISAFLLFVEKQKEILKLNRDEVLNDPTKGLIKSEVDAANSTYDKGVKGILSLAPKQVGDIVTSSGQTQLKELKDTNLEAEQSYKISYANQLKDLNDSLEKKEVSYENYRIKLDKITKSRNVKGEQDKLNDDLFEIRNTQNAIEGNKPGINEAQNNFNKDPSEINKSILDKEKENQANLYKYLIDLEKKYGDDSLKLEEDKAAHTKEIKEFERSKSIELAQKTLDGVKTIIDAETEYRIGKLEQVKQVQDEIFDANQKALEQSTLSAKDKAALEIKLAQQKTEYDKQIMLEERKIKHDNAVKDKEIAVTQALISGAEATVSALKYGPVAAAIVGAIAAVEVATILATKIPEFAEGGTMKYSGIARYGEAGAELMKEPGKAPVLVTSDTIGFVQKGTEFLPINAIPEIKDKSASYSDWSQVKWLAKQLKQKEQKQTTQVNVNVDLGFQSYRNKTLGRN